MQLVPVEDMTVTRGALTISQVFAAVLEKNLSPENVQVAKELLAMDAERKFAAAFVDLQANLPQIVATSVIPNRGKYERFEDVMRQIGPVLQKHGFSVSFAQDFKENRIIQTCHLRHSGGHVQSNSFAVRAGGKADSETQADCKASTTAKRNALLNALNIVIRQDIFAEDSGDASIEGSPITKEQADSLRKRVHATGTVEPSFLKYAGAKTYEEIMSGRYTELDEWLRVREETQKKQKA